MSAGGVETVIVNTLKGINYHKFDVTLLILYKTPEEELNIKRIPRNVIIKYLFNDRPPGYFQRVLYYCLMLLPPILTSKILVREQYDRIITTKDVFTYPISAKKCQKIMWIHSGLEHLNSEDSSLFNKLKNLYKKIRYREFEKIIFLTNSAKNNFYGKFNIKSKSYVLPNPVNTKRIEELSRKTIDDYVFDEKLTIICSSRLSVEKGIERLLTTCKRLLEEGYDFRLLIIGDGPQKQKLFDIISLHPLLKKNTTLMGFKNNPFKYMFKSNLYISPSFTEGYSLSIAEAIVLGLPILSTDCAGPSEILDYGEYGMIVENNSDGIYKGLKQLLSNPQLLESYKKKSESRIEFFNYETNIRLFENIISD